jgi:prepilin-type N-terminal cleavage/methylation domain-containing protein
MKNNISRGFNLVEIAIVLVVFTLVITGVLRGQELINSAKARNLIDQKSSFQTAFIAFSNRYKLMAGDLTAAQASFVANNVVKASACGGDGVVNFDASNMLIGRVRNCFSKSSRYQFTILCKLHDGRRQWRQSKCCSNHWKHLYQLV